MEKIIETNINEYVIKYGKTDFQEYSDRNQNLEGDELLEAFFDNYVSDDCLFIDGTKDSFSMYL